MYISNLKLIDETPLGVFCDTGLRRRFGNAYYRLSYFRHITVFCLNFQTYTDFRTTP